MGAPLVLPGGAKPRWVSYEVVDGVAVMEGDVVLGPAASVALRYSGLRGFHGDGPYRQNATALASDSAWLWPNGDIPYVLDASISPTKASDVQFAIAAMNETGVVNVRLRTPSDVDYLVFRDNGNDCSSNVGRAGGPQFVDTWCARGGAGVLHELMHAAGFFHEHSRMDRDDFVTIVWDEIEPDRKWVFEKRDAGGQDIGPYDYASVMHYPSVMFSKTGNPTIIPKFPASIGEWQGLSALDKVAVQTLYSRGKGTSIPAPTPTAPATFPPFTFPTPSAAPVPVPFPSFDQLPNPFGPPQGSAPPSTLR